MKALFRSALLTLLVAVAASGLFAGDAPAPPETSVDPFRNQASRPPQPNARVTVALPLRTGGQAGIRDSAGVDPAAGSVPVPDGAAGGEAAETAAAERAVKTLARAGGREITDADVMRELWERKGRETFDWMVGKAVLENELERLGLEVTEKEVDDRLDEHMRGLSRVFPKLSGREDLARAASGMGLDEYRERSVWAELALRKTMRESMRPTDEQLRIYFAECQADYIVPDQARIAQIFISPPAGPDGEADYGKGGWAEAERQALEAHTRLRMGEDFRDVASSFADGSSASRWIERGSLMRELEEAAFTLRPGALSAPIRTGMGFHIIRVEERRERKLPRFEDVRERVLADYEEKFFLAAAGDFMTRLKERALKDGTLVYVDKPGFFEY